MPVTEAYVPLAAPRPNIAVGVDYLQWWYKRDVIPSLLNTAIETDSLFAGTENDPTARSLFGTSQYTYRTVPGIRANVEELSDRVKSRNATPRERFIDHRGQWSARAIV